MPKLKITATKMKDADVSFISLVDRGANRIPFKIVKKENPMAGHFAGLDLGKLFTRKSDQKDKRGEVLAVVTMKGDDFEEVKQQVADAGFSVASVQEMEDGSVLFVQGDKTVLKQEDTAGTTVIRLNDHVAVITKGFNPYGGMEEGDGQGTSFADQCRALGFYPGVRTALEVLTQNIYSLVDGASSPTDAAQQVSKLFDEAKAYLVSYVGGLPATVFKLETIEVEKADMPPKKKKPGSTCGTGREEGSEDDKTTSVDSSTPTKTAKEEEEKPAQAEPALTKDEVSSIVAGHMESVVKEMARKMDEAMAAVKASMSESISQVSVTVESLADRVAKAEEKAKVAEDAVKGTVISGADVGDPVPTVKSELRGVYGGRDIDTAFMPQVRRRVGR